MAAVSTASATAAAAALAPLFPHLVDPLAQQFRHCGGWEGSESARNGRGDAPSEEGRPHTNNTAAERKKEQKTEKKA
jgi:hypothetical protein